MEEAYVLFDAEEIEKIGRLEIPAKVVARYFGLAKRKEHDPNLDKRIIQSDPRPIIVDGYKVVMNNRFNRELGQKAVTSFSQFMERMPSDIRSGKQVDPLKIADNISGNSTVEEFNLFKKYKQAGKFEIPIDKIDGNKYHELKPDEYKEILNFFNSEYPTLQEYLEASKKKKDETKKIPEPASQ